VNTVKERPKAMAMAADPSVSASVHHDDVEIVEQLAKLQQMHQQIHDLRSLLPNALIGPAREAIAQPRKADPTQIAVSVIKAAQKGKQDIQSFRQDWQAETTRQLFKDVNAANTPQGGDTWQVDYRTLPKPANAATPPDSQDQVVPFEAIEEAKAALEDFNKSERKIKLQASDPSSLFPIDAEVNRMHFRIVRETGSDAYRVEPVTDGILPQQLAGQFSRGNSLKQLGRLLVSGFHRFTDPIALTSNSHILKLTTIFVSANATNVHVSFQI